MVGQQDPTVKSRMPVIQISDREVKGIRLGTGTYLDKNMRGFMLVSNAASMSYVLQRKVNGRSVRVTLGRVGEISADEARDAAMEAWLQMKKGLNPNDQRREDRVRGMTLKEAYRLFMAAEPRAPKTVQEYDGWFDRHLARWMGRTMEEIGHDRAGVRKLHETITDNARAALVKQKAKCGKDVPAHAGHAMANNVLRLLKSVYNRARVEVPSLPENPTVNVNWHKNRVRDTSLTAEDLQKWFSKVGSLTNPVKRDYWLSVILTGGRRNQIAESLWQDLDLDKGTWHFPQPKGGVERAYTIPISKYLIARLRKRKAENDKLFPGSPWIFPSAKAQSGHLSIPRNDKQGLPLAHTLRHTYRTHSLLAGVSDIESHLLMNHKPDGVNYDYISRSVTIEHLRMAQERITSHFLSCFGIE